MASTLIQPKILLKGDIIHLVAPAKNIRKDIILRTVSFLEKKGFSVVFDKSLLDRRGFFAGTDEQRAQDFQSAIIHPKSKAIIALRGGYGSTRIIDKIDFNPLLENPKWVVGFSDITAFHARLYNLGLESVHGSMPIFFINPENELSFKSLLDVLTGEDILFDTHPNSQNILGSGQGNIIGGNLSLIIDLLGTPDEIDFENKILFIEEVDEYLYRFDRMVRHLKRAGKFERLSGLIVGHLSRIKDTDDAFGLNSQEIIKQAITGFDFPVAFNFPVGHENQNLAIPHGREAHLNVSSENVSLSFKS